MIVPRKYKHLPYERHSKEELSIYDGIEFLTHEGGWDLFKGYDISTGDLYLFAVSSIGPTVQFRPSKEQIISGLHVNRVWQAALMANLELCKDISISPNSKVCI